MAARFVSGQRRCRVSLWIGQFPDHAVTVGLLFITDPALRWRVYPGVCLSSRARSKTGRIRGARRAEGSGDPLKVLFVCIKNASRSPMAKALLKMSARRDTQV